MIVENVASNCHKLAYAGGFCDVHWAASHPSRKATESKKLN